ncbi:MAG: CoA ester lyase [Alphaproteobacteria bacterium]|nr:CoA ester lyase [Alphaproteobacteria bacterium]
MRSLLFAPANHPRRVEKALGSEADVAILDLEDAVAEAEKVAARNALASAAALPRRTRLFVRINALSSYHGVADLNGLPPNIDGIAIPKCESAADVGQVAAYAPKADLLPMIETAKGLKAAEEIARASTNVRRLSFGALDLALDLGLTPGTDEAELAPYRAMIVLASRLAGREPPIDSPSPDFRDLDALKLSCERARRMGFQGKLCIHPDQISVVRAAFAPTEAEIAEAERIVAAAEAAERDGLGAVQVDGKMVDAPVVTRAKRILARR